MRRFAALLAVAALSVPLQSRAQYTVDEYLGTLTSTGTSVNSSSVAALGTTGFGSGPKTIQCDAAVYLALVNTSTGTVTSSNGMLIDAGKVFPFSTGTRLKYAAIISVSGTANCKFFIAYP